MKKSVLEVEFDRLWEQVRSESSSPEELELISEHPFASEVGRKFRFDRCHMEKHVAIEIMGGTYTGGRHTSPSGYKKDCEKLLIAAELQWQVVYLTCDMVTLDHLRRIAAIILSRNVVKGPNHDWIITHCDNDWTDTKEKMKPLRLNEKEKEG